MLTGMKEDYDFPKHYSMVMSIISAIGAGKVRDDKKTTKKTAKKATKKK